MRGRVSMVRGRVLIGVRVRCCCVLGTLTCVLLPTFGQVDGVCRVRAGLSHCETV